MHCVQFGSASDSTESEPSLCDFRALTRFHSINTTKRKRAPAFSRTWRIHQVRIDQYGYRLCILAAVMLVAAACASAPDPDSFGVKLSARGGNVQDLADKWLDGDKQLISGKQMIENGQENIREGEDLVAKGRRQVSEGEEMTRLGQSAPKAKPNLPTKRASRRIRSLRTRSNPGCLARMGRGGGGPRLGPSCAWRAPKSLGKRPGGPFFDAGMRALSRTRRVTKPEIARKSIFVALKPKCRDLARRREPLPFRGEATTDIRSTSY